MTTIEKSDVGLAETAATALAAAEEAVRRLADRSQERGWRTRTTALRTIAARTGSARQEIQRLFS